MSGQALTRTVTRALEVWIEHEEKLGREKLKAGESTLGCFMGSFQNRAMARPTPPWHPRILGAANSR